MGFLHSTLFLYALPAVSLPIIIHLLNRRRFRPVRWAAMEFLLKAEKRNKRRVQIENLLILLLRTLLVLLLILIVSRPLVTGGALALIPGTAEPIERILIFDDSGSLDQKIGRQTAFQRQKDAVRAFIERLASERTGDQITIVRTSRPDKPRVVARPPGSTAIRTWLAQLDKLEPVDIPADLVGAVRTVVSGAASGDTGGSRPARRVLYVLTDLRRTDWLGGEDSRAGRLAEELRAFQTEKDTAILLVDLAGDEVANIGVTDFQCLETVVSTDVPVRFEARVKNFGRAPISDVQLMLRVDENLVPVGRVERLGAGEDKVVKLQHVFRAPGVTALSLEVLGDERRDLLARDDRRYLSVEVIDRIRALVVDGEPAAEREDCESFFLERALAPPGDALSGVSVKVVREDEILDEDLSEFHIVLLTNLSGWPADRLLALKGFVERGGGLAIFVGDRVDGPGLMRDFWEKGRGLLPCPIGDLAGSGDPERAVRLATSANDHPLTKFFAGQDNPFLRKIRFWRWFDVPSFDPDAIGKVEESRRPVVVLSYTDEKATPALVERTYGRGKVLLFNTSADLEWTNWPRELSYVIIMQELARYLAPTSSAERTITAGQSLTRAINPGRVETTARLRPVGYPKAPEVRLFAQRRPDSPLQVFRSDDTRRAGLASLVLTTRATRGEKVEVAEPFAINTVPREGDLRRVDPTRLQGALPEVRLSIVPLVDQSLFDLTEGKRKELWRTLLFTFLVLLVLEGWLALRAGHHRVAANPDEL